RQVDVGEAGPRELREVPHALRLGEGEGVVGAAEGLGDRGVGRAEVADVELVERDVLRGLEGGLGQLAPALGLPGGVGEIEDLAALAVGRQAYAVGVGGDVSL